MCTNNRYKDNYKKTKNQIADENDAGIKTIIWGLSFVFDNCRSCHSSQSGQSHFLKRRKKESVQKVMNAFWIVVNNLLGVNIPAFFTD